MQRQSFSAGLANGKRDLLTNVSIVAVPLIKKRKKGYEYCVWVLDSARLATVGSGKMRWEGFVHV